MKNVLKVILILVISPLLVFGGIPIYSGVLGGKPLLGIIGAILALVGMYGYFGWGFLEGAVYTLQNPPSIGETWVQLKEGDYVFWKSPKINFNPAKYTETGTPATIGLNDFPFPFSNVSKPPYGLPIKKREEWVRWKKTYSIIEPMITNGTLRNPVDVGQ